MRSTNLILGLAPWFLFSFAAEWLGPRGVAFGAALACLVSLALAIRSYTRTGFNLLDLAGVVTFGVMTAIATFSSESTRQDIAHYGRGGAAAVLALIMVISAFTVPFTETMARQEIDPRYWNSPVFRAINRKISFVWAGLIGLMAASHVVAGALTAAGYDRPLVRIVLNWGVPIFIVVRGLKLTEQITAAGLRADQPTDARIVGGAS